MPRLVRPRFMRAVQTERRREGNREGDSERRRTAVPSLQCAAGRAEETEDRKKEEEKE